MKRKKIIVSVTNDLIADNRVNKVCKTLVELGFDVLLVGRKLSNSLNVGKRCYSTFRFVFLINKGPIFYACFNLRLSIFLLFHKVDVLLANDLDTLPANFLIARIKRKQIVYDSHEYFTEVPELIERLRVKKIWERIEKMIIPNLKYSYTVCESIAKIYYKKYNVPFDVVRNVPSKISYENIDKRKNSKQKKIVLYQGAINKGRGLKQAIEAMRYVNGAILVIAGDGDIKEKLIKIVDKEKINDKVKFVDKLPLERLPLLTEQADVGLSIEEDLGLNYHFSLPNKLFDYIQSYVPVLVSDLPEMTAIVKYYGVGEIVNSLEPKYLAKKINGMLTNIDKQKEWRQNLEIAARELVWENEEKVIKKIFCRFL